MAALEAELAEEEERELREKGYYSEMNQNLKLKKINFKKYGNEWAAMAAYDKMIYEDDDFEAFLVGNPRSEGHVAISTKKHFKDMMEIDDETCKEIFLISKKLMNIIKKVYNSESVYLCTMCDGPMNHFHVQLIPRYSFEKRGSKNFVKTRFKYKEDKEKLQKLRELMKD